MLPRAHPGLPGPRHRLGGRRERERPRRGLLAHTVVYLVGFSAVFIALGLSVALVGYAFIDARPLRWRVGGAAVIVMGLHQAGILRIPLLRTFDLRPEGAAAAGYGRSPVAGAAYSPGWTPCIGPVLGSILTLSAVSGDVWFAGSLLAGYSLGMAVPHLAYAVALGRAQRLVRWLQRRWTTVELVSGAVMVVMGVLISTGTLFDLFRYFQAFNTVL